MVLCTCLRATDLERYHVGKYREPLRQLSQHFNDNTLIRSVNQIQNVSNLRQYCFEKKVRQKLRKAQGTVKGIILRKHLRALSVDLLKLDSMLADTEKMSREQDLLYRQLSKLVKPLFFDRDSIADPETFELFVSALEDLKKNGAALIFLAKKFNGSLNELTQSKLSKAIFYARLLDRFNVITNTPSLFKKTLQQMLDKLAHKSAQCAALPADACMTLCAEPAIIVDAVLHSELGIKDLSEMGNVFNSMNNPVQVTLAHRLLERFLKTNQCTPEQINQWGEIAWTKNKDVWITLASIMPPTFESSVQAEV